MQFTQAVRSYKGEVEGWVTRGTVFNVGQEHRPGLRTISEARAKQVIQARLHVAYEAGDPVAAPSPNDPVVQKNEALVQRTREQRADDAAQRRQDTRRKTKVDPPPLDKGKQRVPRQDINPPAPPTAADVGRRRSKGPTKNDSPDGGQTGAAPASPLSVPVGQAPEESTGKPRGMRRNVWDKERKKPDSSQSTKPGGSSRGPTASMEATSNGGDTDKA